MRKVECIIKKTNSVKSLLNTASEMSAELRIASALPDLVDFHAHILPGTDHGSPCLEHSLRQLRCAREAGIKKIVAAPHYYISEGVTVPDFIEKRSAAADDLNRNSEGGIEIIPAAEVHLTYETDKLEHLPLLCVGSTDYILIEMPYGVWNGRIFEVLSAIALTRCLKPIIAHVDRYDTDSLLKLLPFGFILQINADSVCRNGIRKHFMPYIKSGDITLLGSDVHDMPEYSYARYTHAVKLLGENASVMMAEACHILDGK